MYSTFWLIFYGVIYYQIFEFIIYSVYKSYTRYLLCKWYFLPVCSLSFDSLNYIFHGAVLNFDGLCIHLLFYELCFSYVSEIIKIFSCILRHLRILGFTFKSIIYFGWIFVCVVRYKSKFSVFPIDVQLFPCHLLKRLSFLPLDCLCFFVKNHCPYACSDNESRDQGALALQLYPFSK